jgi:hypothetical protein
MLPGDGKGVERCELGRPAPGCHIELSSDAPSEFRRAAFRWEHPG